MIKTVTLADILAAKEARKQRQDEVRAVTGCPIVSISLNMPGAVKDLPILNQLRDYAVGRLNEKLPVVYQVVLNLFTGPEAILAVQGDAEKIKAIGVAIEEEAAFGRLLDLDVFRENGELISRHSQGNSRKCLVCSKSALACMRERSHSTEELAAAVSKLINQFQAQLTRQISKTAEWLGALAVEAMLYEVSSTPAPGLVDRVNSGAHQDMDFYSFMASSAALSTTLARCAQAGFIHCRSLKELLPVLRWIGLEGEAAMFHATGGVNTQKGLLFSLGITAAAAGYIKRNSSFLSAEIVFATVAEITAGLVKHDLESANKPTTAGARLYCEHGITGIRGELENGLMIIRKRALPVLRAALADGLTINDALIETLLVIIVGIDDTTVMSRHNPSKLREWVHPRVQSVIDLGGMRTERGRQAVIVLDEEFIKHNISPGGAADLLAVAWFIHRITAESAD
ncbi:putative 2-(5''-triphosphoribosyl)-3'-dephosphocoenzyme-A synthase [Sporomusaceae bacterium FL31]|nr:putative 2-(5''-triphosphoribosyl)-3'-dephosphocoenzyme-A synthase [Sporomusaceae bacterium FL31]GCE34617.1 putative 2-(5''-triphosphoribosyl)-3'-dephosphocoenzyme-A synthase [Sporomusaceae bacterium]